MFILYNCLRRERERVRRSLFTLQFCETADKFSFAFLFGIYLLCVAVGSMWVAMGG